MWAWLPSVHKKQSIRIQLVLCIVLMHIILLCPFFFFEQSSSVYHIQVHKDLANSSLPVVFLPFQDTVIQKTKTPIVSSKKQNCSTIAKKEIATPQKKSTKKINTIVASPQEKKTAQKKQDKKMVAQKKDELGPTKKIVAKRVEQKPAIKEEQKKEIAAEQKIVQSPKVAEKEQKESSSLDVIQVGRHDLDQLAVQQAISQLFATRWQPPIGLSSDLSCQIKFIINAKGEIEKMTTIESSGVLVYDIAVQAAIQESIATLPKYAYGKEFCITFTQ